MGSDAVPSTATAHVVRNGVTVDATATVIPGVSATVGVAAADTRGNRAAATATVTRDSVAATYSASAADGSSVDGAIAAQRQGQGIGVAGHHTERRAGRVAAVQYNFSAQPAPGRTVEVNGTIAAQATGSADVTASLDRVRLSRGGQVRSGTMRVEQAQFAPFTRDDQSTQSTGVTVAVNGKSKLGRQLMRHP